MTPANPNGIFIKTPSPQLIEVLEGAGLDFAVIDGEHAPFDRYNLDMMMIAGRAASLPLLVRVPDQSNSAILAALDQGAAGVVVPHVDSVEVARSVIAAARYRGGARGFSSGPRHAAYGTRSMKDVLASGDGALVIAQIEHPDAARQAKQILDLDGLDGILIGRADLAVSMGYDDVRAPAVEAAVADLLDSVRSSDKIKGVVASTAEERRLYLDRGANWFIMSNDQSLLRSSVTRLLASIGESQSTGRAG